MYIGSVSIDINHMLLMLSGCLSFNACVVEPASAGEKDLC